MCPSATQHPVMCCLPVRSLNCCQRGMKLKQACAHIECHVDEHALSDSIKRCPPCGMCVQQLDCTLYIIRVHQVDFVITKPDVGKVPSDTASGFAYRIGIDVRFPP